MFDYRLKKIPKNTYEALVDISQTTVKEEYQNAFDALQKELQVEGFRKGKAPKTIAEKHLKKEDIYQEMIKKLLPKIYEEIIKKENLQPIINPKIELVKAKENEDWQVKITMAGKPTVELNDYKSIIKEVKAKAKKAEIWVPGKGPPAGGEKKQDKKEDRQKLMNEILSALLNGAKFEISDLIIEDEVNHRLSRLLDDIQKIGLTVDSYLKSKNLTIEELKKRYTRETIDTYKIEFILQEIADKERISVDKPDLDKFFSNIKEEKERKVAEQNAYFYASILRKQKTLDFLLNL